MRQPGRLVHLLRNTPVRELMRALERDGFYIERNTRTGGCIYRHFDGRRAVFHFHHGSQTLDRKTLANVVRTAEWTENDLRRLGLI